MGPLAGLRILDLTSVLMEPYATQILGDFGADVIKVEASEGDVVRQIDPSRHAGMGALFLNVNRPKRSIALDLKQEAGREVVLRLAAKADISVLPMHSFELVLEDPHLRAIDFFAHVEHPHEGHVRSMAVPTRFSRSTARPERLAPRPGEHGAEVLTEAGFSSAEIEALTKIGVLSVVEG